MKPQDIVFGIVLIVLLFFRKPVIFVYAGLVSILLAIPLFATWIFFTAERLTWYGAAFIFIGIIGSILTKEKRV